MNHKELVEDLAFALRHHDKMVFRECHMGSSVLRGEVAIPDVLTIRKHYNHMDIRIYEVKASNGDLKGDLSRAKWEKYVEYCDRFFFAVGPDVDIEPLKRLPVGILKWTKGGWQRRQMSAKNRERKPWDEDVWMSLMMSHVPHVEEDTHKLRELNHEKELLLEAEIGNLYGLKNKELQKIGEQLKARETKCKDIEENAMRHAMNRLVQAIAGPKAYIGTWNEKDIEVIAQEFFDKMFEGLHTNFEKAYIERVKRLLRQTQPPKIKDVEDLL